MARSGLLLNQRNRCYDVKQLQRVLLRWKSNLVVTQTRTPDNEEQTEEYGRQKN